MILCFGVFCLCYFGVLDGLGLRLCFSYWGVFDGVGLLSRLCVTLVDWFDLSWRCDLRSRFCTWLLLLSGFELMIGLDTLLFCDWIVCMFSILSWGGLLIV